MEALLRKSNKYYYIFIKTDSLRQDQEINLILMRGMIVDLHLSIERDMTSLILANMYWTGDSLEKIGTAIAKIPFFKKFHIIKSMEYNFSKDENKIITELNNLRIKFVHPKGRQFLYRKQDIFIDANFERLVKDVSKVKKKISKYVSISMLE